MNKRVISAVVSLAMLASAAVIPMTAQAAEVKTPKWQTNARRMEELNRGLIAVKTTADTREQTVNGVYLSWRLLGTESLTNQAFDIYKNGSVIHTTGAHDATNWIDTSGTASDRYKVVRAGEDASAELEITPNPNNYYAKPSEVGNGNSLKNSVSYIDIPIQIPADVQRMGDGKTSTYKRGSNDNGANDASVGDLDGDGDYEIVLKWDPQDSKDSAGADLTGNVFIDAYEIDPNNGGYMWRIDLGKNVTAGAHYTQFMVYDFDGDGKAEVAMKTAPGSKDGLGRYVSEVGDTDTIRNVDNEAQFIGTSDRLRGKNPFTQYLTIFDGETGEALWTTEFIPYETAEDKYWGDGAEKYNRSERYLAAVAYLDGVTPSIIMGRGYYHDTVIRAYNWDGNELTQLWQHVGKKSASSTTLYAQGNHNLSIGDIDNDGKDEIVYGSAALDHDGKKVLGNTKLGHGDAMHMSDFNNDGIQEVFSVKEEKYTTYAEDLRVPATGKQFWASGKITTSGDNGRGVMDNIDDAYAKTHPNALALGWSSGKSVTHDLNGDDVNTKPSGAGKGSFDNSLVYWDGDLGRELLDANIIQKYDATNGWTKRFYGSSDGYTLTGGKTNNSSKRNYTLTADLWGDWREEIIMPLTNENSEDYALRIFTSTMPTDYRLTTLMHDCQYRLGIAWQNVAYNQPPHTSYYVGSAALATDASGNELNYLAPAVPYTTVTYDAAAQVAVTGFEITSKELTVEKGKSVSIDYTITPENATKKGVNWTSSDPSVATVANGSIKGVGVGTATITGETKDGGFKDTCTVTVFSNPVTGITLSEKVIELGIGNTASLKANVVPADATDTTVYWSTDDEAVATVSEEGVVTAHGFGKTVITARAGDKTATCIVKVKPMSIVDSTGENEFETSTTLDSTVKFTGAKDSASLTLTKATVPVEFHKDFEAFNKNTATLSFHFTTGGAKEGSDYIWKVGHTYNTELKLLDTNGNNIFNIIEEHTTGGNATKYAVGGGDKQSVSAWKKVSEGDDGPWNRSQIRWDIKVTFDYAADTGTINLAGCSNAWARGETWETTFPLNGASFKTLKYETNTIADWVSGSPKLEALSYVSTEQVSGNTDVLYERGTDDTAWTENDLTDWVQTGTDTATLALDSENGRIWYNNIVSPGTSYSAEKKIEGVDENAIVSYDVDWYYAYAVNTEGNFEYVQFGNKLKLGYTSGYAVKVSADGGETWSDAIFTGANNNEYKKNIKVMFDNSTNTIKSLVFDGQTLEAYTDYELPEGAKTDSVSFGFTRAGTAPAWNVPNGLYKVRVVQFVEGEEAPDFNCVRDIAVDQTDAKTVNFKYGLVADFDSVTVLAALYNDAKELVELKTEVVNAPTNGQYIPYSMTFENDIAKKENVKVFIWDTLNTQKPIAYIMN